MHICIYIKFVQLLRISTQFYIFLVLFNDLENLIKKKKGGGGGEIRFIPQFMKSSDLDLTNKLYDIVNTSGWICGILIYIKRKKIY